MSQKYLYLLLYPNHSLVASMLEPARFAQHYAQGSTGFFGGNFLFIEVDPDFRNDYFAIDEVYTKLVPHEDGRPKATKFIGNYRTLEHISLDSLKSLYYCNALGNFVELKASEYDHTHVRGDELRVLIDINPIRMVAISKHTFFDYGRCTTDPTVIATAPVLLYTQVAFDMDEFLKQFEQNPFLPLQIPGIHPAKMRDGILEVRNSPAKENKGISYDCPFARISYRSLRKGFMFFANDKHKFYPLIPLDILEKEYYQFWKAM